MELRKQIFTAKGIHACEIKGHMHGNPFFQEHQALHRNSQASLSNQAPPRRKGLSPASRMSAGAGLPTTGRVAPLQAEECCAFVGCVLEVGGLPRTGKRGPAGRPFSYSYFHCSPTYTFILSLDSDHWNISELKLTTLSCRSDHRYVSLSPAALQNWLNFSSMQK